MNRLPTRVLLTALLGLLLAPDDLAAQSTAKADSQLLAKACNRFAARLYTTLQQNGPPTCSPGSIALALHLLLPGANGNTADEIARTLQLPGELRGERLALAIEHLVAMQQPEGSEHRLRITNDVWVQRGYDLTPAYIDAVQSAFGIAPQQVDFRQDPTAARRAINQYISAATNNRIPDLLPKAAIDRSTRVVLTNALWFKDSWQTTFSERATSQQPFTLRDGKQVDVPMMFVSDQFQWAGNNDWQCVVMPFANSPMQFEVFVPRAGGELATAESAMLAGEHVAVLQGKTVRIRMPRFRALGSHDLASTLKKLGMTDAFDARQADFSAMHGARELCVGEVVHRAWIDVDEHGAEAAAATAVALVGSAMRPGQEIAFDADRPFAFGLRDTQSGLLWFVGRVDDPRGTP